MSLPSYYHAQHTLAQVKRYLRRKCRKPREMKVQTYLQHHIQINNDELPNLPPFNPAKGLSGDKLQNIGLYGTPKSWQKEMDRQGFDPMENTLNDIVEFMERLEATNEFDGTPCK